MTKLWDDPGAELIEDIEKAMLDFKAGQDRERQMGFAPSTVYFAGFWFELDDQGVYQRRHQRPDGKLVPIRSLSRWCRRRPWTKTAQTWIDGLFKPNEASRGRHPDLAE